MIRQLIDIDKINRVLLVEPNFPIPNKSKNHKNFLPIGLLKIAAYLKENGVEIELARGVPNTIEKSIEIKQFKPDQVWITSLFTYWAKYVREAVTYYKKIFPAATVVVGGIYASLMPTEEVKDFTGCDKVYKGTIPEVEDFSKNHFPAYDLLNEYDGEVDYQILHTSRGCKRRCKFCGTWIIEPEFIPKKSIKQEIKYDKIVFYDNNFLMNPYIENILEELIELKENGDIKWVESQSGFDGRILLKNPELGKMIKRAGFRYPRIAWDWQFNDSSKIKKQIDILIDAGYDPKQIFVFILYNWEIPFEETEKKREKCFEWSVQISDCRYRPLDQLKDEYNPRAYKKGQTEEDYYIHKKAGWTDSKIRQFRRNVRRQNICIRHGYPFYSKDLERKKISKEKIKKITEKVSNMENRKDMIKYLQKKDIHFWFPDQK